MGMETGPRLGSESAHRTTPSIAGCGQHLHGRHWSLYPMLSWFWAMELPGGAPLLCKFAG